MKAYRPRLQDAPIKRRIEELPAVCIDGAKAVGKTETARKLAASELALDNVALRQLAAADPARIATGKKPVLIDEWQRLPEIWDSVRRFVDADTTPNQYLLTGSAYPAKAKIHSGAGRIVHVLMRPLSLQERGLDTPTVSLGALLSEESAEVTGHTDIGFSDYAREIVKSGFPGIHPLSLAAARKQVEGYLANALSRDFADQGIQVRKPGVLRNWLRAYAAATATTASYSTVLAAATPGESNKPSANTTRAYRDALANLWLIDPVEPWVPLGTRFQYLGKTPKHFLVDPALSAALLGFFEDRPDGDGAVTAFHSPERTLLGSLFEALAAQSLKVYAEVNEAELGHFRSSNGHHKVDFIVQKGRRVIAIEVKLAPSVESRDLTHLKWFMAEFASFDITPCLMTTGRDAYTRPDGIHVIPAVLLGA
ncbi:MAG: DUF4143 domain-containing protein [Candidatus Accumulibacter sp.]|jgi:predicted AAA+ superfamily ATPase|nr:DUF4143 domain-containing protein [Accumulibacter sp.]